MEQKLILDGSSFTVPLQAESPGIVIVKVWVSPTNNSVPLKFPSSGLFFRITVGRSRALQTISDICGWLYVITWNLSFYPQVLDNFARKRCVLTKLIASAVFDAQLVYEPLRKTKLGILAT